jgi:hypothetical protein
MASGSRSLLVWIITAAAAVLLIGGFEMARSSDSGGAPLRSEHAQTSHDVPSGMMVVVVGNGKLFHIAGLLPYPRKNKVANYFRSRCIAGRLHPMRAVPGALSPNGSCLF